MYLLQIVHHLYYIYICKNRQYNITFNTLWCTNNYNLYTHTILIKDSFGKNNSKAELDKFELAFKANFYNIETIHHPSTEQNDGSSCGPLTINNLCIIAEYINNHGYKELINNFTTIKFTNNNDVENIREDHQKCIKEINCTK